MIKGKGYSLWFMPTGSVYDRLVKIISQLSKKYSSPNFEPHVTLLAPIDEPGEEITSKTSQLVSLIQPYEIKLTTVDYLDEYFRCLFIRAEETKDVMGANFRSLKVQLFL